MPSPLEKEVQNSIMDYLLYKRYFVWRNNNVGLFDVKSKSFMRMPKYAMKGVADILGVLPDGRFLAIEVKRDKTCKPSIEQKEFIDKVNNNQGVAFVATSIDDVVKELKERCG